MQVESEPASAEPVELLTEQFDAEQKDKPEDLEVGLMNDGGGSSTFDTVEAADDAMQIEEQENNENVMNATNSPVGAADLRPDRLGSLGRSVPFDPFLRTRNVPFHVAGRRRSISVFSTITETEGTDNNN